MTTCAREPAGFHPIFRPSRGAGVHIHGLRPSGRISVRREGGPRRRPSRDSKHTMDLFWQVGAGIASSIGRDVGPGCWSALPTVQRARSKGCHVRCYGGRVVGFAECKLCGSRPGQQGPRLCPAARRASEAPHTEAFCSTGVAAVTGLVAAVGRVETASGAPTGIRCGGLDMPRHENISPP